MNHNLSSKELLDSTIVLGLNNIIKGITEKPEGSCLYWHQSFNFRNDIHSETNRQNLYILTKSAKNVLEIGFNGGHSTALFLHANPKIEILSFDIAHHKYTLPCVEYLKSLNYTIEFVKGSSDITIPKYEVKTTYDIICIDGGHGYEIAEKDLINCKKFAHENTFIVFDDTHCLHLQKLLSYYLNKELIEEVDYQKNNLKKSETQRIFKYIV